MVRVQFAAIAATFFIASTLGSTGVQAQEREFAATVIVACQHSGQAQLTSRVSGVETAGRVPAGLAAALQAGTSCAEAFNLLALGRFRLLHRVKGATGDYDGDGDVDGRDFLIWQRGGSPASARPSPRVSTVLIRCEYLLTDTLMTRVAGSEIAGAIDASLAAVLATRPSCADAYAALAGVRFALVSAASAPAASQVDASDYAIWQSNFGGGG